MQLWTLKAATQAQVAEVFGVIAVSVWRWEKALAAGGVAGLVPGRKGPRQASKLTPGVVARIRELGGQGLGKAGIAVAAGYRNRLSAACCARPGAMFSEGALRPARPLILLPAGLARPDLLPGSAGLKGRVIELPAVVVPDGSLPPEHEIEVGLLLNFLVKVLNQDRSFLLLLAQLLPATNLTR